MTNRRLTIIFVTSLLWIQIGGRRNFGEDCEVVAQIGNIFTAPQNENPKGCNSANGLVCSLISRKCVCRAGLVYQKGILGTGIFGFGGGKCLTAAFSPCREGSSTCVDYAACKGIVSLCACRDRYKATNDGFCAFEG